MMGTRKVEATYKDLTAMVRLDYHKMKRGKLIVELPMLLAGEMSKFYYQQDSILGPKGGVRRIPKVLHEILRHTIMPSAMVEDGAIG